MMNLRSLSCNHLFVTYSTYQLFSSGDSLKLSIADRKRVRNTAFRIWMPRFSKPHPPTKDGLICDWCKFLYQILEEIPSMLVDEAKPIEK